MKNILMIMALMGVSAFMYADADEWPDKECNAVSYTQQTLPTKRIV